MMVGNVNIPDKVVRIELGEGTGDEYCQTADGKWWEKWDGVTRTGQELRLIEKGTK